MLMLLTVEATARNNLIAPYYIQLRREMHEESHGFSERT